MTICEKAFIFLAQVGCQKECLLPALLKPASLDPAVGGGTDTHAVAQESSSPPLAQEL